MSGFVAIFSLAPRLPVAEEEIDDLTHTYESVRGAGTHQRVDADGTARVTIIATEGAGAGIERNGNSWTAFVGRPYYAGSLAPLDLEALDGQFALIAHDARTGEVMLASDPFGMQAVFVALRGSLAYASTSAIALAKFLRARPDRFALEIFLRAGYHFGSRTNWEGIERLEPATQISLGQEGVRRHKYWRPQVDRDVTQMGFDDTVAYCSDVAVQTFRTNLRNEEPHWIDLTGGFDTRLLALLLEQSGVDFICDTRGDVDDDDRRVASAIAKVKGWELFAPELPEDWGEIVRDIIPAAAAWSDGTLQALELAWVLWVHERMSKRRRGLLIGGGGEHWRGFTWSQEFLRAGRSTRVNMDNWVDMRLLHPMRTQIFARDTTIEIRDEFCKRMLEWTAPYRGELNTVQLDMMYAYKMTGHFGAYRSADNAHLNSELPFYFKDPFIATISTNHRHRSSHRLMRHAIWRLDKTVASIGTASGGPAMPWRPSALHRFVPYYARIGRRAVTKLTQTTMGRPLLAPRKTAWWAPPAAWIAGTELLGESAQERRREMRSLSLYDPVALEELLEASSVDADEAELLGRIITVELSLRHVDAGLD